MGLNQCSAGEEYSPTKSPKEVLSYDLVLLRGIISVQPNVTSLILSGTKLADLLIRTAMRHHQTFAIAAWLNID
jgi:hypothetical protein